MDFQMDIEMAPKYPSPKMHSSNQKQIGGFGLSKIPQNIFCPIAGINFKNHIDDEIQRQSHIKILL